MLAENVEHNSMSRNRGEGAGRLVSLTEARRLRRRVTLDFFVIYIQFLYFVQDFMLPGSFSPCVPFMAMC